MDRHTLTLALAGSMASALALVAVSAAAQDAAKEKCYGIALKGQNDCAAGSHDCAGKSKINYDRASFKAVPAGTCATIKTPHGHGMLTPGKA